MSEEVTSKRNDQVMGHPAPLFVLFFSEMWERFSYYGMRALLTLFLISELAAGGWGWTSGEAIALYGTYTMWVYITPILGGIIADKWLGYRRAIVLGALLMTLGHGSMAFETPFFFYLGLMLLVVGNGFFKPNISSMVGQLYNDNEAARKDAGYTIFYMGINAGAFLGILLCGYIGEKIGWSYGFGLAGVFMFFGMMMFWFGQGIFNNIGLQPKKKTDSIVESIEAIMEENNENLDNLGDFDHAELDARIAIEAPDLDADMISKVKDSIKEKFAKKITRQRLVVVTFLAIFSVFFWMCFEQAGGSMSVFAKDYTQRNLKDGSAVAFRWIDAILTIVPMLIISYVLIKLFAVTFKKYALSNIFLGVSFLIIWGLCIWKVNREFTTNTYQVAYTSEVSNTFNDTLDINQQIALTFNKGKLAAEGYIKETYSDTIDSFIEFKNLDILPSEDETKIVVSGEYSFNKIDTNTIQIAEQFADNSKLSAIKLKDKILYIPSEKASEYESAFEATVVRQMKDETEVTASWFQILNSLFIILLAPVFGKFWEKKWNPSAPIKFALGMIFLGLGFGFLALGAKGIVHGEAFDKVSMIWLVFAFLFHTMGELCISPVGLSFVSKLSPKKLVGLMFGVWFFASAMGNKLAGSTGAMMEGLSESISLSNFFLIYVGIPLLIALIIMLLNKWLVKMMHGIK